MTEFQCLKCTGRVEAKDIGEAKRKLDHAIGLSKGRPCAGGKNAPVQEMAVQTPAAAGVSETVKVEVQTEAKADTSKKKSSKSD